MKKNILKKTTIIITLLIAQPIWNMDHLSNPTLTESTLPGNQANPESCCINSKYHCMTALLRYVCIPCIGLKNLFNKWHTSCCNCCIKICGEDEDSIVAQNS